MIIIITGTPGTGKTELAKTLAKSMNYKYIDVNNIILKFNLREGYDKSRDTYIVDEKKVVKHLIELIKSSKNLVIDSHLSHYIPAKYVDRCIITKCDLKILKQRLEKRGYSAKKVRENLDAEIFDICLEEAKENNHKIVIVDTSSKKAEDIVKSLTK